MKNQSKYLTSYDETEADLLPEIDDVISIKPVDSEKVEFLISLASNALAFQSSLVPRRALFALACRNFREALIYSWRAANMLPIKSEYFLLLGKSYLFLGEIDLSLQEFERAVAKEPGNFDYQFMYLQILYRQRLVLARKITLEVAKYVSSESLQRYLAFAKHLQVSVEGGAWCEDGVVTIWMPKDSQRASAKFRVTWVCQNIFTSELVELLDYSDQPFCTLSFPWRADAEICTIKKARNGELLHGCPLFGKLADKSLPWNGVFLEPGFRSVQVIIPVYKGLKETQECLKSVLQVETEVPFKVTLVLDNPSDAKLARFINGLEADSRVSIIRNAENVGFTASVNRALDRNEGEDVVLLNADTVVPDLWLDRLKRAAFSAADIGTVTPISNNGEIVSFPMARERNQIPQGLLLADINRIAAEVNEAKYVDLPTGIGFCMFIRAEALHAVGRLDSFNFGRGYGEETDFCLRARAIGWRSICATDVFVEHVSKVSFGGEKDVLVRLNMKHVQRKHPEYSALMQGFLSEEPLLYPFRQLEREILTRRIKKTWALVVAPVDWQTNPALEKMRSDAFIYGRSVLWLYPDSRIMDRIWLTSDMTFEFGRLFYDLASEVDFFVQDLSKVDINHIHWFEPPKSEAVAHLLERREIPQTCHLTSPEMVDLLTSDDPVARMLTRTCEVVHTYSDYGLRFAKSVGFKATVDAAVASVAEFLDPKSRPTVVQTDKPGISIAVIEGFQSHHGIAKLLELARYVAARNLDMTFYLFSNTLQDIALSRTGKVVPLGFVDLALHQSMLTHLACDAALSVDLSNDPAPIVLQRVAPLVGHVFCFDGAGRTELARSRDNITLLDPTVSSADIAQCLWTTFQKSDERIACAV